jgi:hypothetical protein
MSPRTTPRINHKMYMAPRSPERSPRAVTLAMSLDKSKERVRPECEITLPCKEVIRAWGRAAACDLFMRARRRDDGSEDPSFVLNKPRFRNPGILVTGHNFGAGSSREAAVWGMFANDIRVIVARSFADIYREKLPAERPPSRHARGGGRASLRAAGDCGGRGRSVHRRSQRAAHQRPRRAPMWRAIPNFPKAHAKCCSQSSPAGARHARRAGGEP